MRPTWRKTYRWPHEYEPEKIEIMALTPLPRILKSLFDRIIDVRLNLVEEADGSQRWLYVDSTNSARS